MPGTVYLRSVFGGRGGCAAPCLKLLKQVVLSSFSVINASSPFGKMYMLLCLYGSGNKKLFSVCKKFTDKQMIYCRQIFAKYLPEMSFSK